MGGLTRQGYGWAPHGRRDHSAGPAAGAQSQSAGEPERTAEEDGPEVMPAGKSIQNTQNFLA